ncbi:dTDP-4-dehydrorhamnose reductase [Accumulibacter sp.]|uniref:dTDP-4-dehydrorhamnose reductase n=1 Tax=Accumulibacter sp. TaxID=2053492 RepID=UPI001AC23FEC|nr:dTDP-4-dehydrorhamnose reductase [Accumulibacter sp.]MBN8455295.1 dTDP-4-dehydrorhamnose reductase [Accumulibacter sp.]MBO3708849.1 dTDP-4-dehydrorhamnose reductase [Candidatus Accumulibacter conexus]
MRILLTGKNGQVGFELQRALAPLGEIVAVGHAECELAEPEAIRRLVRAVRPTIIVNPAAHTTVDRAETERERAFAVNATAPRILGEEASRLDAFVVHYSTDYVFDGMKNGPYDETDATRPCSAYGESKREGELALQDATRHHLILRTAWVAGAHGSSFAKTMLRLASERDSLSVVADQWGTPTSAALLADITAHLVRQQQQGNPEAFPYGIYHCVAGGETNWCDYARFVVGEAIRSGRKLRADPAAIRAITTAEYPTAARRPRNSRLDTRKLQHAFGFELPHWQTGMRHVLQQILGT